LQTREQTWKRLMNRFLASVSVINCPRFRSRRRTDPGRQGLRSRFAGMSDLLVVKRDIIGVAGILPLSARQIVK
jgi:hypothetical protein